MISFAVQTLHCEGTGPGSGGPLASITSSPVMAGLGLGIALAGVPGAVQAVLVLAGLGVWLLLTGVIA